MSQILPLMLSSSVKELFSWTYLLKKTPRRRKILISLDWNKILKIFQLIQIEVQCSKNYFKIFLSQEAGAFGNDIEKEPQKSHPKLENMYIIYLQRIFALPAIQSKRKVLQKYINFVERRLKFSHFEGSIIP